MSEQAAEAFFDKLVRDETFRDQFFSVSDPKVVLKKAQDAGFHFAPAEMKSVLAKDERVPDLSDDDLNLIAAGDAPDWHDTPAASAAALAAAAAACLN